MTTKRKAPQRQIETSRNVSIGIDDAVGLPWPIEMLPPDSLLPSPRNARTHSNKQIREIANSMSRFGVICPIVADVQGRIVVGHARAEAAKLLGLRTVPVIRITHLNETEIRAFMLADNKLATKAGWDTQILAFELRELEVVLPELDLDIGITGFDPGEVDSITFNFQENQKNSGDQIPDLDRDVIVAQTDDLFELGEHRLLVADARDGGAYVRLMHGKTAEMGFLDPPYNVRITGHAGGRGRTKHREFAFASGEMTSREFVEFLKETLSLCARYTIDGGINFVCMDWRHIGELSEAGAAVYDALKNICVWTKTTPGQGTLYRSAHEFVFVFKRGSAPHLNTVELGRHGRSRSNVWSYAGVNTFRAGRMDELKMHPTVKPVALIADAMRDVSRRGSIILDAFSGSGSTIMAAEQIGRRAYCIEIDPAYVDVAIRRWQRFTGKDAVLTSTRQTFDELCETR
jgi:DNA modification methylase